VKTETASFGENLSVDYVDSINVVHFNSTLVRTYEKKVITGNKVIKNGFIVENLNAGQSFFGTYFI